MKVLMITPRIDPEDPIHGFIPVWVNSLAQRVDKLNVFALKYNPACRLESNVTVYSLKGSNKFSKFLNFSQIMFKLLPRDTDLMFCHMNPGVSLRAAVYARLFRVPIIKWHTHGSLSQTVRLLHLIASRVVTASEESYGIKNKKVIVTGHGIDTERFKPAIKPEKEKRMILSVGRVAPIKDYETFIEAANVLVNERGRNDLDFVIVGGAEPVPQGKEYYHQIRKMVEEFNLGDYVKFVGPVPYHLVSDYYQGCDLFANMCPTGGADKVVLEAMACGKPVVVANKTFKQLLSPYDDMCLFSHHNPKDMAEKLESLLNNAQMWGEMGEHNRQQVVQNHSVSHLMDSLVRIFTEVKGD